VANELATWRKQFNIDKAKQSCRKHAHDKYSVAVMACGGLLDTLAAIRAGLTPIWGSDTCKLSKQMWKDLVGNECYDDSFKMNTESPRQPTMLKTGFPCPEYTGLGSGLGSDGETGDLYVKQADLILKISPDAAISHLARCRYAIQGPSGQGGRAH
jgi:site-specific DNA-cytosine methylase